MNADAAASHSTTVEQAGLADDQRRGVVELDLALAQHAVDQDLRAAAEHQLGVLEHVASADVTPRYGSLIETHARPEGATIALVDVCERPALGVVTGSARVARAVG